MPWTVATAPDAVKDRYSARCLSVWVRVANAELKSSGDEGQAFRVAYSAANRCKAAGKADMEPLKARLIDDDHFRLLAIPFGGPLKGRDLDGEWFSKRTDIKRDWFAERPVLWHHGQDSLMGDTVIGKAIVDPEPEEDGWWVDVWLTHGERRVNLVKRLAEKAPLFGSSGTIGYLKKSAPSGEILVWPYVEQTLTTSPQNTFSVVKPAKAVLDNFDDAGIRLERATKALLVEIEQAQANPHPTSDVREGAARTGLDEVRKHFDAVLRDLRG